MVLAYLIVGYWSFVSLPVILEYLTSQSTTIHGARVVVDDPPVFGPTGSLSCTRFIKLTFILSTVVVDDTARLARVAIDVFDF